MKIRNTILLNPSVEGGGGSAPAVVPVVVPPVIPPDYVHTSIVEKARKEEKDKLYPQIEALTGDKTNLTSTVTTLQAEVATLKGQIEAFGKVKNGANEVNIPELIANVAALAKKEAAAVYEQQLAAINTEVTTVKTQHRKLTLEQYTAKKIAEAGGESVLVSQLINGNSEAEIDASIAQSKAAYDKIKQQLGAAPTTQQQNAPGTSAPPVIPSGTIPAGGGTGTPEVKNLSIKEYGAQRAQLKAKMTQRYAGA